LGPRCVGNVGRHEGANPTSIAITNTTTKMFSNEITQRISQENSAEKVYKN
jgi:hypothetical protein